VFEVKMNVYRISFIHDNDKKDYPILSYFEVQMNTTKFLMHRQETEKKPKP